MKHTLARLKRARAMSRGFLLLSLLAPLGAVSLRAEAPLAPPLLEFSSGLPGKQVRLSWAGTVGARYAIEKSTTLASGGSGGWTQVDLVVATGPDAVWLDPVATTTKAFYRVSQPLAEVFSISPPVLSANGGALVVHGQCIPAGSFLVIQIPGQAPILVPLSSLENGEWQALVSGSFSLGGQATAVRIQDGNGVTLVTLNQPLEITATGRALDSPGSLPPAPPVAGDLVKPIPSIGIVVKKNPGSQQERTKLSATNIGSSGQDGVEVKLRAAYNLGSSGQDGVDVSSRTRKGMNDIRFTGSDSSLLGIWASRKGYQYYMAKSDLNAASLHNNPYFSENAMAGNMPTTARLKNNKHPDLMKREMAPGSVSPASSGLPGEVAIQVCALPLETPAGPPLQLIHTYRSKPPSANSSAPAHWESCYDISIEPIPVTAGATASRLKIRDGGGRCDTFHRQPNGTYRCDGMFREGSFTGDTFTLTFADKGTWAFNPLSHPEAPGKIAKITDRNGVALTCDYASGQIERVSSEFGQQLTMSYGTNGSLSSAADQSNRTVHYTYYGAGDPDGNEGDLKSISAPQIPGLPSSVGPTSFTYLVGQSVPALDGNLLRITDGASRLLEAFTYSPQANPTAIDFDTCATHDRHRTADATGGVSGQLMTLSFESVAGGYRVTENDELGRVTQTTFDRLHRATTVREYTGFATPGAFITRASFPLSGKLYATDPEFFQSTCAYNADSLCTRITRPDGSQEITTYDRDFRRNCPVRQRGNARVMTLQAAGGEARTVRCDYLPDFGNPECRTQGTPIRGIIVKGGRNPGGNTAALTDKGWDGSVKGNYRKGWDGSVKGNLVKEEGGRHTPFQNASSGASGKTGLVIGAVMGSLSIDGGITAMDDWEAPVHCTRIVSAYGQVSTFGYDATGNCTSYVSALPSKGQLYQYNADGQRTSTTVLNGANSSYTDECIYDPTTRFLSSVVCDSAGLHLTTSCERDNLGRVTRVVDPRGNDSLYAYNTLDDCIQIQSPALSSGGPDGVPHRISTNFTFDAGGCVARCDVEHRAPDGSPMSANPVYSTFFVRDARCRLIQIAAEELPVDSPASALAPPAAALSRYDVCDITLDGAGQVSRLSTPAACRAQATDLACDFQYTERGQLHRCIEGGLGTATAVTSEYAYDLVGATTRCTTLGDAPADSPQIQMSYDGLHRPSTITDPMGNVTEYAYGNDGSMTTSVYGEIDDVPGSAGNVLLSRATARFSSGDLVGNSNDPVCLDLPLMSDACYGLNVKNSAFFAVETEDDTLTIERFTPGSAAPPVTEVTTIDRSPAGLIQQIRCNNDVLMNVSYDTAGRSNACWNGACSSSITRDANGQIFVCGKTEHFSAGGTPGKTFTVTRVLDALGRCVQSTDGVGNTEQRAFDSLGRCVSETEPGGRVVHIAYDGGSAVGAFSSQVSADYEDNGSFEVLSASLIRCGELSRVTDSRGFSTNFTNDPLGRCVRSDRPDGTVENVIYNRQRFVATATFSDGTNQDCSYDLMGRVKTIAWSNLPPAAIAIAPRAMGYDGLGNLRACVQGTSSVTATYDSCGDQTQETHNGRTVSRTFNQRGCIGRIYPDGKRFAENRNPFGDLLSISAITPTGQVVLPPVVSLDYMGHQVCKTTQANGVTSVFTYRADGETSPAGPEDRSFAACVHEEIRDSASLLLSDKRTTRDAMQRQIRCDTGFVGAGVTRSRSTVFARDRFGNIASSVIRRDNPTAVPPVTMESSVSYTHDLDGSRLSETRDGTVGEYLKSPDDVKMGRYTTWPGGALTWDPNGNLATFGNSTQQLDYVHDAAGRVVSVVNPATGPVVTYTYDALGRRASRTAPGAQGTPSVSTTFVYDGDDCIQELGTDGLANLTFVSSGGVKHCISTRNGTLYYPHGGGSSNEESTRWRPFKYRLIHADVCTIKEVFCEDPVLVLRSRPLACVTSSTGTVVERFDCDDACKPIFLTSDGEPSSATSSAIGLRWLSPACAWEPALRAFACPDGFHSTDLGRAVSFSKGGHTKTGHVTLMK